MKKVSLAALCFLLILATSLGVQAAGTGFTGAYLSGAYNAEDVMQEKVSGFLGVGEASLSNTVGVMGQIQALRGSDFSLLGTPIGDGNFSVDATRLDVLGTYGAPSSVVKAAAGYTTTRFIGNSIDENGNPISTGSTVSGALVGGVAELPVTNRLSLTGFAGLGVGMKDKTDGYEEANAGLTTYRVMAEYRLSSALTIQGGYSGSTYVNKDDGGFAEAVGGYFLGARASF